MKTFKNPILPGFYPDPSICRVHDDYYLVTSTFAYFPGIPVFHSKDMINWRQIGNALNRKEQLPLAGARVSRGIFAPTIRHHDGIFYIVTTNVDHGGNFIVTAKDPAGPWSDPYWLKDAPGIDPSLFFDDDGSCWYHGTADRREGAKYNGDNEIYLQRLDLETMQLVGERYALWHGALKDAIWPEAPHIYKKDGWYYLLIAEGGTAHEHAVTVARSKTLTGSYEGAKINPILTHRHLGRDYPIVNVGHGDLVQTQHGYWHMVLLASRPYGGYYRNLGRETFLVPVTWEDGWPIVNYGVGIAQEITPAPNLPSGETISFDTYYDDFDSTLDFRWLHLRNPVATDYVTDKASHIGLSLNRNRLSQLDTVSYLALRQQHKSFTITTKMEFTPVGNNECAGLALFQSHEYHYIFAVATLDDKRIIRLICCEGGEEKVIAEQEVKKLAVVYLQAHAKEQQLSFSYSYDNESFELLANDIDARMLSTDVAGGFVGTTLGLYATSNGIASNNVAYFDWIRYES